jgi:hypothetical protein
MRQMGHTTPHMTLGVYAATMDWAEGERDRLRALVEGAKWQEMGSSAVFPASDAQDPRVGLEADSAA